MAFSNEFIFFSALLVVLSILASAFSSRFGVPILLVFLFLGMLVGEDGPLGVRFDNFEFAYLVSTLSLAVILFDGGMRTSRESFRIALRPALSLATLGVVLTAAITGAFATWLFDLHWLQGLLVGSIVASTDAAAVFALLQSRGLALQQRVRATLEVESGSNDPMAVFMVVVLVEALAAGQTSFGAGVIVEFIKQMALGAAGGYIAGRGLVWLINHLSLESGLYPLLAVGGGVATYGAITMAGGSGFLAIYLAGVILGNSSLQDMQAIRRVNDGFAWLAQIMMFLLLGLLVTPSHFLPVALPALLLALALMLVARPLAVWISLLPFHVPWREQLFLSWVGLRGAVPIVLATFPLLAGLEQGAAYFNAVFIVVLLSLLLQGWTIAPLARVLRLEVPPRVKPRQRIDLDIPGQFNHDLLGYRLEADSLAVEKLPAQLPLPPEVEIAVVIRGTRVMNIGSLGPLQADDYVYVLAVPEHVETLNRMFGVVHGPTRLEEQRFFGDFVLIGDARVADVEAVYSLDIADHEPDETLGGYFTRKFRGVTVIGDRLRLGSVELVVREVENGQVTRVGLKLHD